MRYTDVDRLILERWTEVVALRGAFDQLLGRMRDTVEGAIQKAERWADERGWKMDYGLKEPYIDVYKPEWVRRGDAGLYFRIAEFAPHEYGNVKKDHPWTWLLTQELGRFKIPEAERVQFARELRKALGAEAPKWDHPDAVEATEPIGRYHLDVTEADRIRWMSQPDELTKFLTAAIEEVMAMAPTVDNVLVMFRKV